MKVDRKITPPINEIKSFNIAMAEKHQLSNGVTLYRLNDPETNIVKIEWFFRAGNWFQDSPLVAFAVNSMLAEGSQKFTSSKIAEIVEFYGGQIGYNVDKDNAFISLVCMEKHLPGIIEVMEDIIKNPNFPEHELELFRTKHKQQFLIEQTKVKNIARVEHSRLMFGNNHPYGYMVEEADFSNLNRESLVRFHQQYYQAENCRIVASGLVNDKVIGLIDSHFGKSPWGYGENVPSPSYHIFSTGEKMKFIEKHDAVQSAVRIGKVMFNRHQQDFIGMSVLNCVLGGYFGSRLMKKIREEKGYTYGITSLFVEFRHSGYLSIVSELGVDVTAPAIEDIYNEINNLRKELIPGDELTRVKNYMLGDIIRMFDGPFAQADSLISLLGYDMGYDFYQNMIESIKSIDSATLQCLANTYLDPGSFYQVVVGKI